MQSQALVRIVITKGWSVFQVHVQLTPRSLLSRNRVYLNLEAPRAHAIKHGKSQMSRKS